MFLLLRSPLKWCRCCRRHGRGFVLLIRSSLLQKLIFKNRSCLFHWTRHVGNGTQRSELPVGVIGVQFNSCFLFWGVVCVGRGAPSNFHHWRRFTEMNWVALTVLARGSYPDVWLFIQYGSFIMKVIRNIFGNFKLSQFVGHSENKRTGWTS
jgi:hypothetical protein